MEIVNKVALSPLVTIDLEEYYHHGERLVFDIKDWLFQKMILKERDFRAYVREHDWSQYLGKNVALMCSVDVIIPAWAYMLITSRLKEANKVVLGNLQQLELSLFEEALNKIDLNELKDSKVVIKGCGDLPVPDAAYVQITQLLTPVVSSLMYGEPCSTVPVYKVPRKR
ncbi:MAG: DUF2480 family protein [Bacteroidota bacterium]